MKFGQEGQGLVEYLVLVCLVAVSAIAVVSLVGRNIREQYANISAALRNEKAVKLTPVSPKHYGPRTLKDYAESAEDEP